jgi:regulatory protein
MARRRRREPVNLDDRPSLAGGVVTSIRPVRTSPDQAWVGVDGKRAARVDLGTLNDLGVRVGAVWTEPMEQAARVSELRAKARSYALKALTARPLSEGEMAHRIEARGYPPTVAAAVVADLVRVGLLDDAAYARTYIRAQLSRKAAGRVLLMAALRRKRIDPAIAKEAVDEALGGQDLMSQAADLAARRLRTMKPGLEPDVVRRRLFGMLARRGFDMDACRGAVERVMKAAGQGGGGGGMDED